MNAFTSPSKYIPIFHCLTWCQLCTLKRSSSRGYRCRGHHDGARKGKWTSNRGCLFNKWHLEDKDTHCHHYEAKSAKMSSWSVEMEDKNCINSSWFHSIKQFLDCTPFIFNFSHIWVGKIFFPLAILSPQNPFILQSLPNCQMWHNNDAFVGIERLYPKMLGQNTGKSHHMYTYKSLITKETLSPRLNRKHLHMPSMFAQDMLICPIRMEVHALNNAA